MIIAKKINIASYVFFFFGKLLEKKVAGTIILECILFIYKLLLQLRRVLSV